MKNLKLYSVLLVIVMLWTYLSWSFIALDFTWPTTLLTDINTRILCFLLFILDIVLAAVGLTIYINK